MWSSTQAPLWLTFSAGGTPRTRAPRVGRCVRGHAVGKKFLLLFDDSQPGGLRRQCGRERYLSVLREAQSRGKGSGVSFGSFSSGFGVCNPATTSEKKRAEAVRVARRAFVATDCWTRVSRAVLWPGGHQDVRGLEQKD